MNNESKEFIRTHSHIMTAAEIAAKLNVTRVTVYSWGVRQGLQFKPGKKRQERKRARRSRYFNEKDYAKRFLI